jgi:hypothetical protein
MMVHNHTQSHQRLHAAVYNLVTTALTHKSTPTSTNITLHALFDLSKRVHRNHTAVQRLTDKL